MDDRSDSIHDDTSRRPGRPSFNDAHKTSAERFDRACASIQLSVSPDQPLWRQLTYALENLIRNEHLPSGSRLPSEKELARRFEVSRPVVRNALQSLATRGLVIKLARKGVFVGEPQRETAFVTTNLAAYDDLVSRGHKVTFTNFELLKTKPNLHERQRLQLDTGKEVVRIGRVFWMDGEPISYAHMSFDADKVPNLEKADIKDKPILRYIDQQYNRRPVRADRWFKAVMPPKAVIQEMEISSAIPMIWVESVAYEADNSPLEYYQSYYNSDVALIHLSVLR